MSDLTLSRRSLLKGGGALVVSFSLFPSNAGAQAIPPALPTKGMPKSVAGDEVDGFLAIGEDGRVTVFSGKVDLGTGVKTALKQMAAEELDLPLGAVTVVQGDTGLTPDQGPTYGSLSIQNGGVQIRQAAATARKALIELAADRLGVPAGMLPVRDGTVGGIPSPS